MVGLSVSSSTFCQLPWLSIAIRNNGNYRVCCNANTSQDRGLLKDSAGELNAGDVDLDSARNSLTMKQIRKEMLEGLWPESCIRCKKEEASGIRSKRLFTKDLLEEKYTQDWARSITNSDGEINLQKSPLLDLDVRFGNKCNLACRMCGPSDSSHWKIDFEKMGGVLSDERFDWYEASSFWDSLGANSAALEHIYIVGGEPLLIEKHYDFLKFLIDTERAQKIVLEYNTNLTVLPQKALDLWKKFKKVRVGVSFDGVGIFNDYIRHPSKFSVLERNLQRLDEAEGHLQVWLACTISVYNFHHLIELMRWVLQKNFKRIGQTKGKELFVPHPVHKPEHLNIQCLPMNFKKIYSDFLQKELNAFKAENIPDAIKSRATDIIEKYIHFMNAKDSSVQWARFTDYTKRLDEIRGQNLALLKPLFDF